MSLRRKFLTFATVVGVSVIGGGLASAADSGTHTVTYQVIPTRTLTLGSTGTISIGTIVGTDATGITASGGTLSYTTDCDTAACDRVTAAINSNTASGVTLAVTTTTNDAGTCTTSGTNQSAVSLSTSEASVVTAIRNCSVAAVKDLEYKVTTSGAVPGALQSKTVTYTIKST